MSSNMRNKRSIPKEHKFLCPRTIQFQNNDTRNQKNISFKEPLFKTIKIEEEYLSNSNSNPKTFHEEKREISERRNSTGKHTFFLPKSEPFQSLNLNIFTPSERFFH